MAFQRWWMASWGGSIVFFCWFEQERSRLEATSPPSNRKPGRFGNQADVFQEMTAMNEPGTVSVATWRVFEAASHVHEVTGRHREDVLGVAQVERTLGPAVDAFLPAVVALRAFANVSKLGGGSLAEAVSALHRRTLFWLTHVRLEVPDYSVGDVTGNHKGERVVIDRARGVIEFAKQRVGGDEPSHYAELLLAELVPLFDRVMQLRAEDDQRDLELQRLQGQVRRLIVPVHKGLVPLRALLRNELGPNHLDVRLLNVDAPTRGKKKVEKAA